MGLIEDAIEEVRKYRVWRNGKNLGVHNSSTPRAYHQTFYLQLRQDIFKGIRVVTKTIGNKYLRSPVYQILIQALTDIFQYGYTPELVKPYNDLLDQMIGYH